ncbi:hypothetical protein GGF46_002226 [Coemansia sp. RSA 552]|nr:hypothetical protein GGF46_002226 [Coemansia sp. RSA 552]
MPLVRFDDDAGASAPGARPASPPRPSASWQDKRAERVHMLEAALTAAIERQHTGSTATLAARDRESIEYDYGSALDSEDGAASLTNSSSSHSRASTISSQFYGEGQPLLCTYQPRPYPGTSTEATAHGSVSSAAPKSPTQYLPWDRRLRDTLQVSPAPMLFVRVHPPLGVLTAIHGSAIPLRVYFVGTHGSDGPAISDCQVWTDLQGRGWHGIPLHRPEPSTDLVFLDLEQLGPGRNHIQQFHLDIEAAAGRFEFTVRWRLSQDSQWQWAGSFEQNAHVIVYPPQPDSRQPVDFWRRQLKSTFSYPPSDGQAVTVCIPDSWHISPDGASCIFRPGSDGQSFCQLANVARYLAFVRKDQFWIIPHCGASSIDTNGLDVVVLLVELLTGVYTALTAFSKDPAAPNVVALDIQPENCLRLRSLLPLGSSESVRVAVSTHRDPHRAVCQAIRRVQEALPQPKLAPALPDDSKAAHGCSLTRYLGFCTWNAFYQHVSHEKVVATLSNIQRASATNAEPFPKWALIDDGWQMVDTYDGYGRLYDIGANRERFPGQLKPTADALAKLGVCRVGVWHALWGYWGGIDPDGPLSSRYELVKCHRRWSQTVKGESDVWLLSPESVYRFYDDFYSWLCDQGVSFVKVDYQAAFESLASYNDACMDAAHGHIMEMYAAHCDAMELAARKYFGDGGVVHCMSQSPFLLARMLQRQKLDVSADVLSGLEPAVFRNSDDYFPDEPASHGWHIYCNMANSVWSRALGGCYSVDWDMFTPGKPESHIHAASRVVSGGPVYVSGLPTDFEACQLSAIVGDGCLVRHAPVLMDKQCLFVDMTKVPAILLGSMSVPRSNAAIIALFNVSSDTAVSPIPLFSIYSTTAKHRDPTTELYAVHQQSTGKVHVAANTAILYTVALLSLASDTLTVVPMIPIPSSDRSALLYGTCIGDTSRYAGISAVERNVYSILAPSSGADSPVTPPHNGQKCWNIRARVTSNARHAAFVFYAREASLESRQLTLTIAGVRLSTTVRGVSTPAAWSFDDAAGLLTVTLPPTRSITDEPTTTSVTVSLCG